MLAAALASDKATALERHVQKLRLVKSDAELTLMNKAGEISSAAHAAVMKFASEGKTEGMLQARFEYECAVRGSERPAYVPVVASGWVFFEKQRPS
jgi:intermediate cleaving peptidase 55